MVYPSSLKSSPPLSPVFMLLCVTFFVYLLLPEGWALYVAQKLVFLDASSHLYKRVCPSVRMSVCLYVR